MSRALILSPGYPPRVYGGVGSHVHDLATGLARRGWSLTVITDGESLGPEEAEEEGVRVVRLRLFSDGPECDEIGLRTGVIAGVCARVVQEGSCELFHFHDPAHFAVARGIQETTGIPVLLTQHQTFHAILSRLGQNGPQEGRPLSSMPELQRREEQCMAMADGVICVSEVIEEELRAAYPALPPLRVIPNGVEIGRFSDIEPDQVMKARAPLADPAEVLVLFVGRSIGVKGLPELMMAASLAGSEAPELRFGFVLADAKPSALASLRSLEMLAGHSTFLGNVAHSAIPAYYAAADVVAMPSRWEPFGLVAIEAMAAGTPVVVSDVSPLNRIVTEGVNGRVVPRIEGARGVVDVRALARTIVELARMSAGERKAMGLRGRRRAEDLYSARTMVDRTAAAYRDLLHGPWSRPLEAVVLEPVG